MLEKSNVQLIQNDLPETISCLIEALKNQQLVNQTIKKKHSERNNLKSSINLQCSLSDSVSFPP